MKLDKYTLPRNLKNLKCRMTAVEENANFVALGIQVGGTAADLVVGDDQGYFSMPYNMTLTNIITSVLVAPTGASIITDVTEGGVSILSTLLTIDVTTDNSEDSATPVVISDTALAKGSNISINIDQVGSTIVGQEMTIWLIGYRTL